MHFKLSYLCLTFAVTLFSSSASAQEVGPEPPEVSKPAAAEFDAAAFDEEMGEVHLVVFSVERSAPVASAVVRVGGVVIGETSEDGALTMELFGGLYHITVDIGDGIERTAAVRVVPGQVGEALLEIREDDDSVNVSVEQGVRAEEAPQTETEGPTATLTGRVVHAETGAPIENARVFVRGESVEAVTDSDGRFRITVTEGTRDVVVVHPDFGTVTKSGVEVSKSNTETLVIEASPGGVELEEFTVTAPKIEGSSVSILSEKRDTAKVTDIIGAEQMSKSGDSDAASALKRVTGITIVGGKYVYVRGLGERYTSTLLNNLRLPSPDPERRVVPLDMFPSGILESMIIQKTYSPEMPGEFGGGTVNLRTKKYPKEGMFKIELSGAFKPGTTFAEREFGADSGPTDFLGIDGGHRAIPKILKDATDNAKLIDGDQFTDGYSAEELAEITRAMPNNWKVEDRRLAPDVGVTVTGGKGFSLKNTDFGFFSSLMYKNEWDARDKSVRDIDLSNEETGELSVSNHYEFFDTTDTVTLGGLLALGVDFGEGQSIVANTLVDRITDNEFSRYTGFSRDLDRDVNVYQFNWVERMMIVQQVLGSHVLHPKSGLKLDWRYAFANAQQDQPDKRHTRYDWVESEEVWQLSVKPNGNKRSFIEVDENSHDMGVDLTLPFKQWTEEDASVSAGGAIFLKQREVDYRVFGYEEVDDLADETLMLPPWQVLTAENIEPGGMVLREWTQPTDNYSGEQEIFAGYLSGDLPLGAGFAASGGVRFEKSIQDTETFERTGSDKAIIRKSIDTFDVLPAVTLTYRFYKDMLLRVGYGKTLNRPDFREMSPVCATSYAGGGDVCGAPEEVEDEPYQLNRTVIHNVDARWEWYFSADETLSIGAFYKKFIDPIESVLVAAVQKSSYLMNASSAVDVGIEVEGRKNFGFAHPALEDLYMAVNAAWIYSRIDLRGTDSLAEVQTSKERPLQGQSPYVVNAQIGYDNPDLGLNATLLYNVYGPRISDVGSYGVPDVYEQEFHQLDLVIKKKLKHGFDIGFKAKNLIDLPVEFTQGDETTEKYKKGRSFSLSASWSY